MKSTQTNQPITSPLSNEAVLSFNHVENCLDLDRLRSLVKQCTGYDNTTVNHLTERYVKWLSLKITYKNQSIVPTTEIDIVWHQHILDSEQYFSDCTNLSGEYIHHRPHLKQSSSLSSFKKTKLLWKKHYNEDLIGEPSICD